MARLESELEKNGYDKEDAVYRATLGTLVRMKLKVRVMPHDTNKVFDYEKLRKKQRPTPHGIRLNPDHPPPYPYKCDPKCETCFTQTFPARIGVTDEQALARVTTLTTSINDDLDHLRSALRDHADYIVKKWSKSKAKRSDVLNAICAEVASYDALGQKPDGVSLYDKKWAAVHLIDDRSRDGTEHHDFLKGSKHSTDPKSAALMPHILSYMERIALEDQKDRFQTTWLLPYLDFESLVEEPLLFLSLLHARTIHAPVSLLL